MQEFNLSDEKFWYKKGRKKENGGKGRGKKTH